MKNIYFLLEYKDGGCSKQKRKTKENLPDKNSTTI